MTMVVIRWWSGWAGRGCSALTRATGRQVDIRKDSTAARPLLPLHAAASGAPCRRGPPLRSELSRRKAVTAGEIAKRFDGLVKCRSTILGGGHGTHFLRDHLPEHLGSSMAPSGGSASTDRAGTMRGAAGRRGGDRARRALVSRQPFAAPTMGVIGWPSWSVTPRKGSKTCAQSALRNRCKIVRTLLARREIVIPDVNREFGGKCQATLTVSDG
jgi:hypothetical protein